MPTEAYKVGKYHRNGATREACVELAFNDLEEVFAQMNNRDGAKPTSIAQVDRLVLLNNPACRSGDNTLVRYLGKAGNQQLDDARAMLPSPEVRER
mmetsp:Transcript_22907/g.65048  ORF Transcript_22907/g.65048 Transcript_22907/m.65048 type:complete len:96 (-) Transcript_22907:160-447(-)